MWRFGLDHAIAIAIDSIDGDSVDLLYCVMVLLYRCPALIYDTYQEVVSGTRCVMVTRQVPHVKTILITMQTMRSGAAPQVQTPWSRAQTQKLKPFFDKRYKLDSQLRYIQINPWCA